MDGLAYLARAQRDAKIVSALKRALEAMALTHGGRINMAGIAGTLNYEPEMLSLRDALALLGVDPDEPQSPAQERAETK